MSVPCQPNTPVGAGTLELGDGRMLRYDDVGDPSGVPVIFVHGNGHCRLGRHPDDSIVADLGVRLVAIDRPGLGGSTFQPGRVILDLAGDVARLADALGFRQFSMLAWSSGAAYALACAHELPRRIERLTVVAGLGPGNRTENLRGMEASARAMMSLGRVAPFALRGPLALMRAQAERNPARLVDVLFAAAPKCDRDVLAQPSIRAMFAAAYQEAARGGTRGLGHDVQLLTSPWGFELADIRVPVSLWHGDADTLTPPGMARFLAHGLREARLNTLPGEGHQFVWPRWAEIIGDLVA